MVLTPPPKAGRSNGKAGETRVMLRFVSEVMKLPVSVFVSSMETIVRAMRELQEIFNSTVDRATNELASGMDQPLAETGGGTPSIATDGKPPEDDLIAIETHNSHGKEKTTMSERDLSADNLKTVRYRIIF